MGKGIATSKKGQPISSLALEDYFSYKDRFWSYVEGDRRSVYEHWLWTKCKITNGYGQFAVRGIIVYAHVTAWILHNNMLVPSGKLVTHQCTACGYDKPDRSCCNPFHLALGDYSTNRKDAFRDGHKYSKDTIKRMANKRLTPDQVHKMRQLAADGMSHTKIGHMFGVSTGHATNTISGKRHGKHCNTENKQQCQNKE